MQPVRLFSYKISGIVAVLNKLYLATMEGDIVEFVMSYPKKKSESFMNLKLSV